MTGRGTRGWDFVALLLALLPLLGFWTYGLFDLDEGFYAAAAREMLRRGEWVTPLYQGHPWFEKPILLYWMAIPSIAAFGEAVGPRLPSVLCSAGTLLLVFAAARRWLGEASGRTSVLVLGSSILAVGAGRMMLADPPLILFLSAALLLFWASLTNQNKRLLLRIAAAACLGVAVLAKGPVAGLLTILIFAVTYWREPDLRPAFRGGWPASVAAFFGVVAVWYVPAYLADGSVFVDKFLIEQNIGRFTGGDAAHTLGGPLNWLFYVGVLLLGMFPWSLWVPAAWPRKGEADERDAFRRYLGTWALVVFVFFSLSGAKLPHYVLPAFPPLAMLVGARLASRRPDRFPLGPAIACVVVAIIVQGAFVLYYGGGRVGPFDVPGFHREVHDLTRWLRARGGSVAVYRMSRREADRGTGTTELRETAHPSIFFYLDRPALDTDDLEALESAPKPLWVLTRIGRIDEADRRRLESKFRVEEVTPFPTRFYTIYRLSER